MGLFDFVKGVGDSLFGPDEEELAKQKQAELDAAAAKEAENLRVAQGLRSLVDDMDLGTDNLVVEYNEGAVVLTGTVPSQAHREKLVLLLGNIDRVVQVDDQLEVAQPEPEASFYVVQKGDSLSKIAKTHYGDYQKYPAIFEANRPMLVHPDKIYPGQTLRIPPKEAVA